MRFDPKDTQGLCGGGSTPPRKRLPALCSLSIQGVPGCSLTTRDSGAFCGAAAPPVTVAAQIVPMDVPADSNGSGSYR